MGGDAEVGGAGHTGGDETHSLFQRSRLLVGVKHKKLPMRTGGRPERSNVVEAAILVGLKIILNQKSTKTTWNPWILIFFVRKHEIFVVFRHGLRNVSDFL
jgi:hypothetical protein